MRELINKELNSSIEVKQKTGQTLGPLIEQAAKMMIDALRRGNKVMFFGNGGSAADAQHLAGEMIGRFLKERRALPAIALTTDSSILTSLANDYGFDIVFARQIEGLAQKGDIAFGLSTSGNSKNVLLGLEKAKELGCRTIGLLGCDGGRIAPVVDLALTVPCRVTPRVQESHITIGHILCLLIEKEIFPGQ